MTAQTIRVDDLSHPRTRALLAFHLNAMQVHSPPGMVHALDLSALQGPDITVFSVWSGEAIAGLGALKTLPDGRAEIDANPSRPPAPRRGGGPA